MTTAARSSRWTTTSSDGSLRTIPRASPEVWGRAAIDEIQRAPDLILALKKEVDERPDPGRYLITGSVDLFRGMISPDSLAGRVETVELLPFSQAEIAGGAPPRFLDRAFAGDFPAVEETGPTADLIERIVSGGYPSALARTVPARRRSWLRAYAQALAERDVSDIAPVGKRDELVRLIDHAAASAGQLLNMSGLGARLGVDGKTVDRWLVLLEHMFLIRRVRAWHNNRFEAAHQDAEAPVHGFRPARGAPADGHRGHRAGPPESGAASGGFRARGARQGHRAVG